MYRVAWLLLMVMDDIEFQMVEDCVAAGPMGRRFMSYHSSICMRGVAWNGSPHGMGYNIIAASQLV